MFAFGWVDGFQNGGRSGFEQKKNGIPYDLKLK